MTQTIETGLRDLVAEHGLHRLDMGFAAYRSDCPYGATVWWVDATDALGCASGHAATVDEAVEQALTEMAAKRFPLADVA